MTLLAGAALRQKKGASVYLQRKTSAKGQVYVKHGILANQSALLHLQPQRCDWQKATTCDGCTQICFKGLYFSTPPPPPNPSPPINPCEIKEEEKTKKYRLPRQQRPKQTPGRLFAPVLRVWLAQPGPQATCVLEELCQGRPWELLFVGGQAAALIRVEGVPCCVETFRSSSEHLIPRTLILPYAVPVLARPL